MVREGLSARPRRLPSMLFYDEEGSRLFDAITQTPEYYLTETERRILTEHAAAIVAAAGTPAQVVELGAGSAAKTRVLLSALLQQQAQVHYTPIDVSPTALAPLKPALEAELPGVQVTPVVARNRAGLAALPSSPSRRLVLFLGSSIGNMDPMQQARFLRDVAEGLGPGDRILLGTDRAKARPMLERAYNDAAGVTAAFNRNALVRLNREMGADFELEAFRHRAFFNVGASRVEMHLEAGRDMRVEVQAIDLSMRMRRGETIHTESSYKFTDASLGRLCKRAGLAVDATWADPQGWFSVQLLRKP
ncbi:MAG: L-histidine Nalpha-methyltransferase [Thermoplasmata archaeon]|nr:L-histidine Nalpha-methyltransferase [Thermoplasmata archaeon]